MRKYKEKLVLFSKKAWDFWEKWRIVINFLFVFLAIVLYSLGYLDLIRENGSNLITFAVALLTLNGVFLTLLVTLKESLIFEKLRRFFPELHDGLYEGLKRQVAYCIYFIVVNLIIGLVGPITSLFIAYTGLIIWAFLFSEVILGTLYNLRVVKNLVQSKAPTRNSMS